MTLTQFGKLADLPLAADATAMAAQIVASPTTYGLSAAQATEMADLAELFSDAVAAADAARILAESATFDKDQQREALLATFSQYLNLMYATPTVSPSEIMR